jgi:actin-related protein 6
MNMMDEYLLMERIKERLCYVARDVRSELSAAAVAPRDANRIAKEYVLPDGVSILRGYVKGDDPGEGAFGGGSGGGGAAAAKRAAAAAGGAPAEQARGWMHARTCIHRIRMHARASHRLLSRTRTRTSQLLPLCNERFMVPEALLHPSDIGSPQAGLAECAAAAVAACGADIRGLLWANVVLVGAFRKQRCC